MILINKTDKQKILIESLSKKIKSHFGNLMDEGFEFESYWITCRKKDQSDLSNLLKGIALSGKTRGLYRCYTYITNIKANKKQYVSFSKEELDSIFEIGFSFIIRNIAEESKLIESLFDLTLEELENFSI